MCGISKNHRVSNKECTEAGHHNDVLSAQGLVCFNRLSYVFLKEHSDWSNVIKKASNNLPRTASYVFSDLKDCYACFTSL